MVFSTGNIFAQNEMKARIEYEDAETAFQNKDFKSALTHLEKAETALGKWTAKISYLKIMATDKVIEYAEWNEELKKLKQEVTAYMKYANTNPENIDMERVREIYAIEVKLNQIQKWKDNEIQWKKYDEIEKKWESDPDYILGIQARKRKDTDAATSYFQKAALKGNPSALYMLGYIHSNENESLKYYQQAIDKGHAGAMYEMGNIFDFKKDYKKAKEWYDLAIEKGGDSRAIKNVGVMYMFGNGQTKEIDEGVKWYIKATKRDKTGKNMNSLADYYTRTGENDKAMYWHERAAEKGLWYSMYELGEIYLQGKGVSKNPEKAFYWIEKATEQSDNSQIGLATMYKIAEMYRKGIGTAKNNEKAYFWYTKYIETGRGYNISGYTVIGKFFLEIQKEDEAVTLLETAADGSNPDALELLGDIYYNGHPAAEKNYEKAIKCYLLAYKNKDRETDMFFVEKRTTNVTFLKEKIATMYEQGLGVEKDKKMAKEWRSK